MKPTFLLYRLAVRFFATLRMTWWGPDAHPGASLMFNGIIGNFGALCLRMVAADYEEMDVGIVHVICHGTSGVS